jgi:phosphatidylserine decarboxylase
MSAPNAITFFNRYTGAVETETIYGEGFLRWVYETAAGRAALKVLVKKAGFSRWYGWRMDRPGSRAKIAPFIRDYRLDPSEFLEDPESYTTFNEFFYRKLKPAARPIDPAADSLVFPADGRHLALPDLSVVDGFWVKGQRLGLEALLGDGALAARYARGSLLISRLCPVDYHRFHFPVAGVVGKRRLIKGSLSSVSPVALRRRVEILAENKREVTEIESEVFGKVLMLEIGATCVGGIEQTYTPGKVAKGGEKGFFRFGGSMTMVLLEPGRVRLSGDLVENGAGQREVYARMGDRAGVAG